MTDEEQNIEQLALYTDRTLRDIIYHNSEDYMPYIRQAAEAELRSRYSKLLEKGEWVPLSEIIDDISFDDIACELKPIVGKWGVKDYKQIFDSLLSTQDDPVDGQYLLHARVKPPLVDGIYLTDESGSEFESYGLSDGSWRTVKLKTDDILRFGSEILIAYILIDMAYLSFDRSELNLRANEDRSEEENDGEQKDEGSDDWPDAPIRPQIFVSQHNVHPWRRYFARQMDMSLYGLALYLLIRFVYPDVYRATSNVKYVSLLSIAAILIEIVLLTVFGTTPGKKLLGIRLVNEGGDRLTLEQACKRCILVWTLGNALYISFLSVIANIVGYDRLKNTGSTWWDDKSGTVVSYEKTGNALVVLSVVINLASAAVCVLVEWRIKYRG